MNLIKRLVTGGTFIALGLVPTLAGAQDTAPPAPAAPLPPPRSHAQTPPPPPTPQINGIKVTKEAGIGGTQSYARAGVLELGGAFGFEANSAYTQMSVAPSIGWFVTNNFEVSGIASFAYVNTDTASANTNFSLLAEPSYHLPFSDYLFGFAGVGAGITTGNRGTGLALVPRVGLNIMVGRSGILTPAVQLAYSTAESLALNGSTGAHAAFGANVGYTVMW